MPKKPMPQFIEPMQASSVKDSFDSPDWIFETKLDGYRAIAVVDSDGKARIWSRKHLTLEPKFPTVLDSVNKLNLRSTILDGEIVALDAEGIPRFQLLQQWQKRPTAPVVCFLFDLLWSDGRDITGKTVLQRRERLQALLLAAYRDGQLRYFGHSGSGFSEKGLQETIARLEPLFIDKTPVENPPKIPGRIQSVQPKLVCEVAFAEWTLDGELRQTTFVGWRDDKSP